MAIANNPGIVDDAVQMVSARIVLTNAQAGDNLNVGNLPAGIEHARTTVNGQIIVTLTGAASLADYQRAIQAVTFSNNSNNPVAGNRVIEVTVNDGFMNSNVATTTVNVVPVNDAPNADNDIVFTNITTAPIVIPEWALLANDTDGEGQPLDITQRQPDQRPRERPWRQRTPSPVTGYGHRRRFVHLHRLPTAERRMGTDTASVNVTRDTTGTIDGNTNNNILIGDAGDSTFDGEPETTRSWRVAATTPSSGTPSSFFGIPFETRRTAATTSTAGTARRYLRRERSNAGGDLQGLHPRSCDLGGVTPASAGHGDRHHPTILGGTTS